MNINHCPSCGEALERDDEVLNARECPEHGRLIITVTHL